MHFTQNKTEKRKVWFGLNYCTKGGKGKREKRGNETDAPKLTAATPFHTHKHEHTSAPLVHHYTAVAGGGCLIEIRLFFFFKEPSLFITVPL